MAPQISLELEPNVLWPPDHKLRTIHARVTISDACHAAPSFVLKSIVVTGENGSPEDVVAEIGEATTTFQLRAERSGRAARRYLITYTVIDASGNEAEATATVLVPHDRGNAQLNDGSDNRTRIAPTTELISIEPNPFNPSTSAMITLARAQHVTLDVYDV